MNMEFWREKIVKQILILLKTLLKFMILLTIPIFIHDASICILEDGKITFYQMEERFSKEKKHDCDYG